MHVKYTTAPYLLDETPSMHLGEELYKYLCFRSNPINYLYLSMYMYAVLNYEINMFKLSMHDIVQ